MIIYNSRDRNRIPMQSGLRVAQLGLWCVCPVNVQIKKVWLTKKDWGVDFVIVRNNLFNAEFKTGLKKESFNNFELTISSRERAIFEVLYLIPKFQSFDEAVLLMQNLTTLRPSIVQKLLENCNSIRVKRTFMVLAEKENHDWLNELKVNRIDFGKGKRSFFKGGYLHPKYQITVPEQWKSENGEVSF